jgi:hypothetical protein
MGDKVLNGDDVPFSKVDNAVIRPVDDVFLPLVNDTALQVDDAVVPPGDKVVSQVDNAAAQRLKHGKSHFTQQYIC